MHRKSGKVWMPVSEIYARTVRQTYIYADRNTQHPPDFTKFSAHDACGSVLLRRECNMLRNSAFVGDVIAPRQLQTGCWDGGSWSIFMDNRHAGTATVTER